MQDRACCVQSLPKEIPLSQMNAVSRNHSNPSRFSLHSSSPLPESLKAVVCWNTTAFMRKKEEKCMMLLTVWRLLCSPTIHQKY